MTKVDTNNSQNGNVSRRLGFRSEYSVINTNESSTENLLANTNATSQKPRGIIVQIVSSKTFAVVSTIVVTVLIMLNVESVHDQLAASPAIYLRRNESQTESPNESTPAPVLCPPQNESPPQTVTRDFAEYFASVPWQALENSVAQGPNGMKETDQYISQIVSDLADYTALEPRVPINESCSVPPPLLEVEQINCSAYPEAFNGVKRATPAKVGILVHLGFDIDVLEIHLREVYDVVDYFFITESTKAHFHMMEKPLMWEKVREQPRFKIFADKIVHIVVDDAEAATGDNPNGDIWKLENFQHRRRWEKFVEWNSKTKFFSDDDILGFGDTDEVASRDNIHLLKHCEITEPVDIGIWMPFGLLDHAYRTYAPVRGHTYTLGDPTYWTVANATAKYAAGGVPNRLSGNAGKHLLGGMHMTDHRYLPFMLIKGMTCTECGMSDPNVIRQIGANATTRNVYKMELNYGDRVYTQNILKLDYLSVIPHTELDGIVVVPWFLGCNLERYPYWEKGHDTRLDPY